MLGRLGYRRGLEVASAEAGVAGRMRIRISSVSPIATGNRLQLFGRQFPFVFAHILGLV